MWEDAQTRAALLAAAATDRPDETRMSALVALVKLADAASNQLPMWEDAQTRGVLLAAAAAGQPDTIRGQAVRALANLTVADSTQVPMWEDAQTRGVLLAAAAAGQPVWTREQAIRALSNLAIAASHCVPMWEDAQVRGVLLAAAAAGQPDGTRMRAVRAFANLADAVSNQVPMWQDAQTRGALLAAAAAGQPDETREEAICALASLASAASNKVPMWQDAQVRGALLAAAAADQPDGTRKWAIGALVGLAGTASNKVPMWEDAQVRGVLLAAAAAGQPDGTREEALRALSNLTNAASTKVPMWQDAQVRGVLLAAVAAGQPVWTREHAIRALASLSRESANQLPIWEATRELLLSTAAAGQPLGPRSQSLCCLATLAQSHVLRRQLVSAGARELLEAARESLELSVEVCEQSRQSTELLFDLDGEDDGDAGPQHKRPKCDAPLAARLAALRRTWARRGRPVVLHLRDDAGGSGSLFEACLAQVEALPEEELFAAKVTISYEGQSGVDAGGLARQCFADFATSMEGALSTSVGSAKLFKLTETGALTPSSAETLAGKVGTADEAGAIVPECSEEALQRYQACGRMCGLALVSQCPLGRTFARYFVRILQGQPPTAIDELQDELREEFGANHALAQPAFVERRLSQQGLAGVLSCVRQATTASLDPVPLAPNPDAEVSDENKQGFLLRYLTHQLVSSIDQQANAFRRGVEDVTGPGNLGLLSPDELKELWAGQALDDSTLAKWRARTRVQDSMETQAAMLWEWLSSCSPDHRSRVLQFTTGSTRLPSLLTGWRCTIERKHEPLTIHPTEANGLSGPAMCAESHTCVNQLLLPMWESMAELERGMEQTLAHGAGYGFI